MCRLPPLKMIGVFLTLTSILSEHNTCTGQKVFKLLDQCGSQVTSVLKKKGLQMQPMEFCQCWLPLKLIISFISLT